MIVLGDQQELAFPNTNLITAVKLVEDGFATLDRPKQGHIEIYFSGSPQVFNINCSSYAVAEKSYKQILEIIAEDRKEMRTPAGNDQDATLNAVRASIAEKLDTKIRTYAQRYRQFYRKSIITRYENIGIWTFRDLVKHSPKDITYNRQFGKLSITTAEEMLERNGLRWGFPEQDYPSVIKQRGQNNETEN